MAYTPQYVKELQEKHSGKFWKVYDRSGRNLLDANLSDIGLDESIELLQGTLNNVIDDYVRVKLFKNRPEKTEKAGTRETFLEFQVKTGKPGQLAIQQNPYLSGQPTWVDMMQMNDKLRALEIEKLKNEMENEKTGTWQDRLIDMLENNPTIISGIINFISTTKQKPQPKISEPQQQNNNTNDELVTEVFQTIKEIDSDGYREFLAKINQAFRNNPENYWLLKKM